MKASLNITHPKSYNDVLAHEATTNPGNLTGTVLQVVENTGFGPIVTETSK